MEQEIKALKLTCQQQAQEIVNLRLSANLADVTNHERITKLAAEVEALKAELADEAETRPASAEEDGLQG